MGIVNNVQIYEGDHRGLSLQPEGFIKKVAYIGNELSLSSSYFPHGLIC